MSYIIGRCGKDCVKDCRCVYELGTQDKPYPIATGISFNQAYEMVQQRNGGYVDVLLPCHTTDKTPGEKEGTNGR